MIMIIIDIIDLFVIPMVLQENIFTDFYGDTTLSIMTPNIMSPSMTTFSITTLSILSLFVTLGMKDTRHERHSA